MTNPDYQFVQLTDAPEADYCGLTLPVSSGEDIKFQFSFDELTLIGSQDVQNFITQNYWNLVAMSAGTSVNIKSVLSSLMIGGTPTTKTSVDVVVDYVKPDTTTDFGFAALQYNEDGTNEDPGYDNLLVEIYDETPYYYDPQEEEEIEDAIDDQGTPVGEQESDWGNNAPEDFTLQSIPIIDYEDETIIIESDTITAKRDCTIKLVSTVNMYGHWDRQYLEPPSDNNWQLNSYSFNILKNGTIQIDCTPGSITQNLSNFTCDVAINEEVSLAVGDTLELFHTMNTTKTLDPDGSACDWELRWLYSNLLVSRVDATIVDDKGAWFKVVMTDENDEVIQVSGVDVINDTFKRTNLALDDNYGISINFDDTVLVGDMPSQKVKFFVYEIEKGIVDVDHLIAESAVMEYVKDDTWLVQGTRVYDNPPFWEYVQYEPTEDTTIAFHNAGTEDITIILNETTYTLEPDTCIKLIFDFDTLTWSVEEYECETDFATDSGFKAYVTDASGRNIIQELTQSVFSGVINCSAETFINLAVGDCFRIKLDNGSADTYYTNIFSYIGCETDETVLIHYYSDEDGLDFIAYSDDDRRGVSVRLPLIIKNPQYPQNDTIYEKLNGDRVVLSSTIKEEKEMETDYMPEAFHKYLVIALGHDQVTFDGTRMLKSENYDIKEDYFDDDCDNRYRKASAKLQYNITHRNANIGDLSVES